MEHVWLGCGCFWSAEEAYRDHPGVLDTEVGFLTVDGAPVEVVQLTWDVEEVSLRELLDLFFRIHDPTADLTLEEPGARSVIGLADPSRLDEARAALDAVMDGARFEGDARTVIVHGAPYRRAADEHQGYLQRNTLPQ